MTQQARPEVGLPRTALGPHAVARWAAEMPEQVAIRRAAVVFPRVLNEDLIAHSVSGAC